jgi:hypothetical protein
MDELAGMKGTENTARQRQFLSLRDTIERIASDLFDEAPTIQGYVDIQETSEEVVAGRPARKADAANTSRGLPNSRTWLQ